MSMGMDYEAARDVATRFLAYRARTRREVEDRLRRGGFSGQVIDEVIEILLKYNYINDGAFAADYAEELLRVKGYGRRRIKYELFRRGVPENIISDALRPFDEDDELEAAIKRLEYKYGDRRPSSVQQCLQYLLRRGVSLHAANAAMKQMGYIGSNLETDMPDSP
ncbi:MAG: regulatory protein RecX [Clostridiales bacterium]|jgi:regulatory protein|nr:regulatory protein RecX [Clostridiales bacterium]